MDRNEGETKLCVEGWSEPCAAPWGCSPRAADCLICIDDIEPRRHGREFYWKGEDRKTLHGNYNHWPKIRGLVWWSQGPGQSRVASKGERNQCYEPEVPELLWRLSKLIICFGKVLLTEVHRMKLIPDCVSWCINCTVPVSKYYSIFVVIVSLWILYPSHDLQSALAQP